MWAKTNISCRVTIQVVFKHVTKEIAGNEDRVRLLFQKTLVILSNPYQLVSTKEDIMEYIIEMPYIGGVLSENNYKFKTRGTKPFVKMWMRELAEKVKQLDIPKCETYEVGVFGKFTDERRPDISNLFKVTSDSVERGLGINDKHFRMVDKGYSLGHFDPELIITIKPLGGKSE